MTGNRMTQIYAQAQDSFVKSKWDDALEEIVRTCNEKANIFNCFKQLEVKKLRREIVRSVTKKLVDIFELDGFDLDTIVPVIIEILYLDHSDDNSFVQKYVVTMTIIVIGGVEVTLMSPLAWLAAAGSVGFMMIVFEDLSQSNLIVLSCLEVVLVIERIFWFGASQINDKIVKAATLYYLKKRPKFLAAGKEALSIFDDIKELKPTLAKIIKDFRYQRQNIETTDEKPTQLVPLSIQPLQRT